MPVYTPKRLGQAVLTTSSLAIYTAPASTSTIIKEAVLANTSANSQDATLYIVPTPGTAAAAADVNCVVPAVSIPAGTVRVIDLSQVLNTGDILAAKASAGTAITITVSGVEIV